MTNQALADKTRQRLPVRFTGQLQRTYDAAGAALQQLSGRTADLVWRTRKKAYLARRQLPVRFSELSQQAGHSAAAVRQQLALRISELAQRTSRSLSAARQHLALRISELAPWMKRQLRSGCTWAASLSDSLADAIWRARLRASRACRRMAVRLEQGRPRDKSPRPPRRPRRHVLPIWIIELLRHLRKTAVSFLALTVIICVSVAIVLGTDFSGHAMSNKAASYFEEYRLHDFELLSPFGFTPEELAEVQSLDWVEVAEGSYGTTATMPLDQGMLLLTVLARSDQLDLCRVMEGALPEQAGEIAIEETMAAKTGLAVGDKLTLDGTNAEGTSLLAQQDYVICGVVRNAAYINSFTTDMRGVADLGNGAPRYYVLVTPEAFDHQQLSDCYTRILISATALEGKNPYDDAYWDAHYDINKELTHFAALRGEQRFANIRSDAEAQLNEARQQIAEYEQQLAEAEQQLQYGESEARAAEAQIAAGEQQVSSAKSQLYSAQQQIAANEQQLAAAQQQLHESRFMLDNYQAQSAAGQQQIAEGERELQQARQQLQDANIAIQVAEAQIDMAQEQLDLYDHYLDVAESTMTTQLSIAGFSIEPIVAITEIEAALTEIGRDPQFLRTLLGLIDEFYQAKDQLADKQRQLDDAEDELEDAQDLYAEQLELFQQAELELSGAKAELSSASSELAVGELEYKLGASQVASGEQQLAAAKQEVSSGWNQVYSSNRRLEAGRAELESSRQQLADGQIEVAEGRQELEKARQELAEAEAQFAELKEEGWSIQDLNSNIGYASMKTSSANVRGLRFSFALVFILVALMVCFTSIGRMFTEQRELIGAQKALGLTTREIMRQFFAYSGLAGLLGTILGWLTSLFLVQKVAVRGYSTIYVFDEYDYYFDWGSALLVLLVVLAVTAFLTWSASRSQLREAATDLLRGQKPPLSKALFFEKWPGWRQRSLYTRLSVKNLLNDKRRMIMTIVGLAGCTALLVICLSLRMSIVGALDRQYDGIYAYDQRLITDQRGGPEQIDAIAQRLDAEAEQGVEYLQVSDKLNYFRGPGGGWNFGHVICGDELEHISDFLLMEDEQSGEQLSVPFSGVLISAQAAEVHGWQKGDNLQLMDHRGDTCVVTIDGIFQNYAFHLMVMSSDYYRSVSGKEPVANTFYINTNGADSEALLADLAALPAYMSHDSGESEQMFQGSIMLVVVMLILSAVMAAMVLLDLNFMFIKASTRQLAVMRVNGYTVAQTKAYIYRDNIVLTVVGLLAGVGLGLLLASSIILGIEEDYMRFIRDPIPLACILAAAINALFMLAVNLITLRKIDKLNLYSVSAN